MAYQSRYTQQANNTPVTGSNYGRDNNGSTRNNRGIIRRGGNIAGSLFVAKAIYETSNPRGPVVYFSDDTIIAKVLGRFTTRNVTFKAATGNFATLTAGSYIIRRVTTALAGTTNTVLRSAAAHYSGRRSIHKLETWRQETLTGFSWTASTATVTAPGSNMATYLFTYTTSTTSNGLNISTTNPASAGTQDSAARPSLATPGQLIYKTVAPTIKLDVYKVKTLG